MGLKIKNITIHVNKKKYTKNEIYIDSNFMNIYYNNNNKYRGDIMIDLKNPSERVSNISYKSDILRLEFKWAGPWENYDTGKDSYKELNFKIDFKNKKDGDMVWKSLIENNNNNLLLFGALIMVLSFII